MGYKRYENESDEELIYRICSEKEIIGSWQDVADILNELTDSEYTESKYRKQYQSFQKMLDANQEKFIEPSSQLEQIKEEKRNLIKERNKLQTEKLEYSRWIREEARDELITEKILDAINNLEPINVPENIPIPYNEKGYLLTISDIHYGKELEIKGLFGETINEYSPEICERRLWELYDNVCNIIDKENIDCIHIYDLGDDLDGILRVSQLMKLRYGVVDSTIKIAELLSNWLNELSRKVKIKFSMCLDDNHGQLRMLGEPKGTFTEDNMSKIIFEFIKVRLKDNPNFDIFEQSTSMIYDNICGYNILACHGEVKNMTKAIQEYSSIYNIPINYMIAGHKHHASQEDIGIDSEVINIPSIIGIDDYSMKLRKTSNPAAKMFVFEKGLGKTVEYTFKLK